MAENVGGLYLLAQELKAHEKAIRSICVLKNDSIVTVGLDGLIIIWTPQSNTNSDQQPPLTYHPSLQFSPHKGAIYFVISGPDGIDGKSTFFTGGQDKSALWMNLKGEIILSFRGHSNVVSSLNLACVYKEPYLVTGSWDSTAKIWDLHTGDCSATLTGHKHAVAVSSWSDESQEIVITGSQDGCLRLWSSTDFKCPLKIVPDYHSDIIRNFCVFNNSILISCSNDGTLNAFDLANQEILKREHLHDCFVYDLCTTSNKSSQYLCTAPDDGEVAIINLQTYERMQTISHGFTVWCVAALSNGDLLTGTESGALLRWTSTEKNAASLEQRAAQVLKATEKLQNAMKRKDGIDLSTLPDISELNKFRGKKIGQHKLFRKGLSAYAYTWNGLNWECVGEMISDTKNSLYYEGDDYFASGHYDYIFKVEIGDTGSSKLLPYRNCDNTLVVAEKFCTREGISRMYTPQIEDFIRKNSSGALRSTTSKQITPTSLVNDDMQVPKLENVSFKTINAIGLKNKILEFNSEIKDENLNLTELELSYLDSIIEHLSTRQNWVNKDFRICEMDFIFRSRLNDWPEKYHMPIFDLWRIFAIHPQCIELHKKSDGGWRYISKALKYMKLHNIETGTQLCALRYLTNLFTHPLILSNILKFGKNFIESFYEFEVSKDERVRSAVAAIFINMSIALGQSKQSFEHNLVPMVVAECFRRFEKEETQVIKTTLLMCIETILRNPSIKDDIKSSIHIPESISISNLSSGNQEILKRVKLYLSC